MRRFLIIIFKKKLYYCLYIVFLATSCVYLKLHTDKGASDSNLIQDREIILNKTVKDLNFFPINGLRFRLSEIKETKAIVIFMREKDCPISEKYGPRIAQLEKKYSQKGIRFIYNYVGQIKVKENAEMDLKKFRFTEPYVIDSKQTIINALSAKTTGEVFILTPNRRVIYRGPVDDQFHLLKSAIKPKINYVSDILDNVISGKKVIPKIIPAPGCIISRPVLPEVVYWQDVAPIIQDRCSKCHHPKEKISPINFVRYEDVAGRGKMFEYVVENDLMPPWSAADNLEFVYKGDLSLGVREKALLLKWARGGFKKKRGGVNIFLNRENKKEGIENPDYSIKLPKPKKIQATGFIPYHRFEVHNHFQEDKWIKEIEFILKPKVIHHITFFIVDKSLPEIQNKVCKKTKKLPKGKVPSVQFVWTPGMRKHIIFQKDQGIRIPKTAKIFVTIHYEPIGEEIIDNMTEIRFTFSKKPPINQIIFLVLFGWDLKILPEDPNYENKIVYSVKEDLLVSGVMTHMHLRGKAGTIFITTPNNKRRTLLNIYPWNFNFHRPYWFKEPVKVSKGSLITCINWFDNSSENIINPDPKQTVSWGLQTKDEMSICGFFILLPSSKSLDIMEKCFVRKKIIDSITHKQQH